MFFCLLLFALVTMPPVINIRHAGLFLPFLRCRKHVSKLRKPYYKRQELGGSRRTSANAIATTKAFTDARQATSSFTEIRPNAASAQAEQSPQGEPDTSQSRGRTPAATSRPLPRGH
ncbi:hypothetical protein V495_00172 [Pseudogymnoascus sp. VKM F-4514 (FW-929)]|nr:hypothetical protein V495_00172 [Pseudogymnoascus sp. VKM F-4514 (FW-929)]KFY66832.1 hypothetical protein V497_00675 [Pseudogymnoascus sp. VKM F-4516 (FW-969)]